MKPSAYSSDAEDQVTRGDSAFDIPAFPYPGLRPFEADEWSIFFGRESIVDAIVTRLLESHTVLLHGLSGSGKSSVMRAGVLPRLLHENRRGKLGWRVSSFSPGQSPLDSFAEALALLDGEQRPSRFVDLRRILNMGDRCTEQLREYLHLSEDQGICVLMDQFEELFDSPDHRSLDEAQVIADILRTVAQNRPHGLYFIVAMRSEKIGACAALRGFGEVVNQIQYLLPRISHADLLRAIQEPGLMYNCVVSRELAERFISEVSDNPDQLPLIQHGLQRLYDRKRADKMDALDADGFPIEMTIGLDDIQPSGSLDREISTHADDLLQQVTSQSDGLIQNLCVEHVFRALANVNLDGTIVRRPRTLLELEAETGCTREQVRAVVDAYRAHGASFLKPYGAVQLEPSTRIDISHEALIRCWHRLAIHEGGWLQTEYSDGQEWRTLLSRGHDGLRSMSYTDIQMKKRWVSSKTAVWAERYGGDWERMNSAIGRVSRRKTLGRTLVRGLAGSTLAAVVMLAGYYVFRGNQSSLDNVSEEISSKSDLSEYNAKKNEELLDIIKTQSAVLGKLPTGGPNAPGTSTEKLIAAARVAAAAVEVKTFDGYVWIGNDSLMNVGLVGGAQDSKVSLADLPLGQLLISKSDLAIRSAYPTKQGDKSEIVGQIESGQRFVTTSTVQKAPGSATGTTQYWVRISVPSSAASDKKFVSLFIGQKADLSKSPEFEGLLYAEGFRVTRTQVYSDVRVFNEVRFCRDSDENGATKLQKRLDDLAKTNQPAITFRVRKIPAHIKCETKMLPGRLELYMENVI